MKEKGKTSLRAEKTGKVYVRAGFLTNGRDWVSQKIQNFGKEFLPVKKEEEEELTSSDMPGFTVLWHGLSKGRAKVIQ